MNALPTVSILIPTYNHAQFLDETIQSVLSQDYEDYELIIVDNHSTDETDYVISNYIYNPKVKFYKNEQNIGLVANWNKCLELAKGEYIKFLCSDDKFHSKIIKRYVDILDENPDVVLVSCKKEWFGKGIEPKVIGVPFTGKICGEKAILHLVTNDNYLGEPSLPIFRKSALSVGGFNSNYSFIVDWEMWIRILSLGSCYIIPEVLCYTRKHLQRQTVFLIGSLTKQKEEYELFKKVMNGEYSISPDKYKTELQQHIKRKAIVCAKEMLKTIPHLHTRKGRKLFMKMFPIAYKEKVIFKSIFFIQFNKSIKRGFSKNKKNDLLKA